MTERDNKRRNLRSSNSSARNTASLYNFDNVNTLLHGNGRIRVDRKSSSSTQNPYEYFGDSSWVRPQALQKFSHTDITGNELPRLRRRAGIDPLPDSIYETFHKRMKKDEKSRTMTDRGRMYFEMDIVKSQLELLGQHDWAKHLPSLTVIKDRNDFDELTSKRRATISEIEKTLAKFSRWEARNAQLTAEMKAFDTCVYAQMSDDEDDDGDDEESILIKATEALAEKRRQKRIAKHGRPVKILLRNGSCIKYNPYRIPAATIEPSTP